MQIRFDAGRDNAVIATRIATLRYCLLAVDCDGERSLGEYRFNHTPMGK